MNVPDDLRYSPDHEWIRVDGTLATIGVTDYAQEALGDVVYVDLPAAGLSVAAGDTFTEVESTKSVSDIYAPVSGSLAEVNGALADTPELINNDPYGDGWICKIEMSDASQLDGLLDADAYRELIGS